MTLSRPVGSARLNESFTKPALMLVNRAIDSKASRLYMYVTSKKIGLCGASAREAHGFLDPGVREPHGRSSNELAILRSSARAFHGAMGIAVMKIVRFRLGSDNTYTP